MDIHACTSFSTRVEFTEKLDYAFAYGEELAKLLRSHGFKSNVGLSLDGSDSETGFAVLLANMSHVFGPISRDEVFKLLDLDFEYESYDRKCEIYIVDIYICTQAKKVVQWLARVSQSKR
ncbi:hypothetical protein CYMTET_56418 [Cymbomonas tetramitiformis]|uniref:Uncharacterized protein n=1 Tax=Cymbomonas tetramitiformis TaxID=36881 RepID=A0AAE0BAY7_9CHLO|nr:hypothetical protein CYMTET_56418 [Cymbomonas tetramitiformis]